MTARRRLLPRAEIVEALDLLAARGIDLTRCTVDITTEGVRVSPPANESPAAGAGTGNAFDQWKNKDANRDRPSPR